MPDNRPAFHVLAVGWDFASILHWRVEAEPVTLPQKAWVICVHSGRCWSRWPDRCRRVPEGADVLLFI
ncbi:MAG: hypothetical protein M3H12_08215 [Chromatiales bacterium]